jgi:hypothetical protein
MPLIDEKLDRHFTQPICEPVTKIRDIFILQKSYSSTSKAAVDAIGSLNSKVASPE